MADTSAARVMVFGDDRVRASVADSASVTFIAGINGLLAALAQSEAGRGFVIWADAIAESDIGRLVNAIGVSGARCIEVRAERWDGRTPSPLSAASTGVISGFGVNGVGAAVRLLSGL